MDKPPPWFRKVSMVNENITRSQTNNSVTPEKHVDEQKNHQPPEESEKEKLGQSDEEKLDEPLGKPKRWFMWSKNKNPSSQGQKLIKQDTDEFIHEKPGKNRFLKIMILLAAVVLVLALAWISSAERDRKQGAMVCAPKMYYGRGHWLLAPYNRWLAAASLHPNQPVYKNAQKILPETQRLKDAWTDIRDEALALYKNKRTTPIDQDKFFDHIAPPAGGWKRFYIKWYSDFDPEAEKLCPKTCALVRSVPSIHLAMFSVLEPGAFIKEHRGVFRGSLRYHLGLATPNDSRCRIVVDGQTYSWRDGEDVVFDDCFLHSVRNDTDKPRIILFVDVERPLFSNWAQRFNNWACLKFGPLTTRKNDLVEKADATNF